jgi:hypothetical protein
MAKSLLYIVRRAMPKASYAMTSVIALIQIKYNGKVFLERMRSNGAVCTDRLFFRRESGRSQIHSKAHDEVASKTELQAQYLQYIYIITTNMRLGCLCV